MPTKETLKSIHGRQLGLDRDGGLVRKEPFEILTAGSGALSVRGITLLSSAASTYTLGPPPEAGIVKRISTYTPSTLARNVARESTAFYFTSTDGSTMVKIAMASNGAGVTLLAASTSQWVVTTRISTDTTVTGTS